MKQYFQAGKGKYRLVIDHAQKTYSTNYWYLGGWEIYIKVRIKDIYELEHDCAMASYKKTDKF